MMGCLAVLAATRCGAAWATTDSTAAAAAIGWRAALGDDTYFVILGASTTVETVDGGHDVVVTNSNNFSWPTTTMSRFLS